MSGSTSSMDGAVSSEATDSEIRMDTVGVLEAMIATDTTGLLSNTLRPIITGLQQEQQDPNESTASLSTESARTVPLMYGMPLTGVQPIAPDVGEFVWEAHEYASTQGDETLPQVHEPAPSKTPPANCWYPQAPSFHLEENLGYRRGKVYWSNFYVEDKSIVRRHALCTINPPDIEATFDERGVFIEKPLPGMTRQIMGIPYIQRVNGNPHHTITVAVAQTSNSLERFGNGISTRVKVLEKELFILMFGSNPNGPPEDSIPALYNLGLKRNDRSSKPPPGSTSKDGSYSLAATVEKGQGQGCFQPAVQNSTPLAQQLIGRALTIVHELQQLIMPCCISKFEMEMIRFITDYNNIFVFGGLGPGATGLQLNVSSGLRDLLLSIGELQGRWHTDYGDEDSMWSMVILMLKLPPGSDPGPFMLGRFGLYIRETGLLIIYLVFRGNDLHSGYHPSYRPENQKAWIDKEAVEAAYDMCAPEQRCVLVPYATRVGVSRSAEVSVTPPVTFMNMGAPVLHKLHSRTFAEHGKPLLGSAHDRYTRLGREITWAFANALEHAGLTFDGPLTNLFQQLKYKDDEGNECTVGPPPFDLSVEEDARAVTRKRGLYAWHKQLSQKFLVPITKDMYRTVQACIKFQRESQEEMFAMVERRPIQSLTPHPHSGEPSELITDIIGRDFLGGKTVWQVRLLGNEEIITVAETKGDWLFQSPNREKLLNWIQRHLPLTSPALRKMYQRMLNGPKPILLPETPVSAPDESVERPRTPLFLPSDSDDEPSFSDLDWEFGTNGDVIWKDSENDTTVIGDGTGMDINSQDGEEHAPQDRVAGGEEDEGIAGRMDIDSQGEEDELEEESGGGDGEEEEIGSGGGEEENNTQGEEDQLEEDEQSNNFAGDDEHPEGEKVVTDEGQGAAEEGTFEIAGIVEYSDQNEQLWRVRWTGYRSKDDSWLGPEDFINAKDMFDAYNRQRGIIVRGRKRPHSPDAESVIESDSELPSITALVETSTAFQACVQLLSSVNIDQEMECMRRPGAASASIKLFNPAGLLTQMADLNITNTWISSYLQYDALSNDSSLIRITRLQEGVQLTGSLLHGLDQVSVLAHTMQWELGRILLIVYEWLTSTAPALVDALLLAQMRGAAVLNSTFPDFALLTDHVILYVEHFRQQATSERPKKKKKKGAADEGPVDADTTTESAADSIPLPGVTLPSGHVWPPTKLDEVPEDLYGLRTVSDSAKTVKMPPAPKRIYNTATAIQKIRHDCLLTLLCRELVWIPMGGVDKHMNTVSRRRAAPEDVHARLISRGAVVQCLVDACGEGILACNALFSVLKSPTTMFPQKINDDKRFVAAIALREEDTLRPLRNKLAEIIERDPDIPFYAEEMARLIHHRTLEFQHRHTLSEEQVDSPHTLPPPQRAVLPRAGGREKTRRIPVVKLSAADLVDAADQPVLFALPAVILREALSKMRKFNAVDEPLRRILDGQNPSTGSESRINLDHVNPARAASVNLQLLKKHLPGALVTTEWGLSNLLAWMITGQGYMTSTFLAQNPLFFFTNAQECINRFKEGAAANTTVVSQYLKSHPRAKLHSMKKLASYTVLVDPNVWGQASNHLTLNPTIPRSGGKTVSSEDKFSPCYMPVIPSTWTDFIGPLRNQDPVTYIGPRRTWLDAVQMIRSLGIDGVKGNGLTTLQLANNLVLLGICVEPTAAQMGAWIADNPGLGAFKGLVLLGFKINESDPAAIHAAFQVFYNHLDTYLSDDDKRLFTFGAIFVEHLLCKVQRWHERYAEGMPLTLLAFARGEVPSTVWIQGGNLSDPSCFPFPFGVESAALTEAIRQVMELKE
ncbi:hypothetical protein C8F04DRAFT_1066822 [Mycena alexandri]|uniref:Chromo domain-containing protein n=1 Tax=Mycena alexandri TaxID=1745969 RepID=A0AAD6TG24_9AGAR|nr:hypothetical protein C8F04DRAFT_1066822 [Mycena alexandri]